MDLRHRRGAAGRVRLALPAGAHDDRVRRPARGRRGRRRRRRDPGADPLRAREAGARGGQARLRREAAGDARRGDGGARRPRRGARARAHARPPAPLPPGPPRGEAARRRGGARRGRLRLRQPAEPRRDPLERERAVVARRPRPLRHPLAPRRGAERGGRARDGLPAGGDRGRRLLLPPLPVGPRRAHAPLVARPAQDAQDDRGRPREDGRLRRHGARAQGDRLREGAVGARVDLRRVAHADGRHLQPEDRERRAPAGWSCSTSCGSSQDGPGDHREAHDGLAVVRTLDRLTTSLRTGAPA